MFGVTDSFQKASILSDNTSFPNFVSSKFSDILLLQFHVKGIIKLLSQIITHKANRPDELPSGSRGDFSFP